MKREQVGRGKGEGDHKEQERRKWKVAGKGEEVTRRRKLTWLEDLYTLNKN